MSYPQRGSGPECYVSKMQTGQHILFLTRNGTKCNVFLTWNGPNMSFVLYGNRPKYPVRDTERGQNVIFNMERGQNIMFLTYNKPKTAVF